MLFFWVPYCLKIANKISKSFMIQLNASDWGVENFLSMTSEDPNNLSTLATSTTYNMVGV